MLLQNVGESSWKTWKIVQKSLTFTDFVKEFSLRKKRRNTQIFLVRIFPYLVKIRENTDQKKLCIWTIFTQCLSVFQ